MSEHIPTFAASFENALKASADGLEEQGKRHLLDTKRLVPVVMLAREAPGTSEQALLFAALQTDWGSPFAVLTWLEKLRPDKANVFGAIKDCISDLAAAEMPGKDKFAAIEGFARGTMRAAGYEDPKDVLHAWLRSEIRRMEAEGGKVRAVLRMDDIWRVVRPKSTTSRQENERLRREGLAEETDRQECLQVTIETPTGLEWRHLPYTRDDEGRVTFTGERLVQMVSGAEGRQLLLAPEAKAQA